MTEAQKEAIEKIHQIMAEHFDAGLIVITADCELVQAEEPQVRYHGGIIRCLGLMHVANLYLSQGLQGCMMRRE